MEIDLPKGAFCLEGYIEVPAEKTVIIEHALKQHIVRTREEEGCLFFNVTPYEKIPGRYRVREAFIDEAAFQVHQLRAQNSAWGEASVGLKRSYKTWVME